MGKQPQGFKVYLVVPLHARAPWVLTRDPSEKEAPARFSLSPGTSDDPRTGHLLW